MTTMPNRYVGARVEPTEDAEQLFRLVREDIALDGKDAKKKAADEEAADVSDDPAAADDEIAVQVRNGTRTDRLGAARGRANTVTGLLVEQGFAKAVADPSVLPSEDRTVVRYPSADLEGDAQRVAKSPGDSREFGAAVDRRLGCHAHRGRRLARGDDVRGARVRRPDPGVGRGPQRRGTRAPACT